MPCAVDLLLAYGALYLAVLLLQRGLKFLRDLYIYKIAEGAAARGRCRK